MIYAYAMGCPYVHAWDHGKPTMHGLRTWHVRDSCMALLQTTATVDSEMGNAWVHSANINLVCHLWRKHCCWPHRCHVKLQAGRGHPYVFLVDMLYQHNSSSCFCCNFDWTLQQLLAYCSQLMQNISSYFDETCTGMCIYSANTQNPACSI